MPLLALLVIIPAFLWAGAFHFRRNRTRYILTNRNLTIEVGIIAKQSTHIPLAKIQDVTVNRSVLGRLLSMGTVVVESAGEETRIPAIAVDNPVEVSRRILSEVHARGQTNTRAAT
jgi:membrane protein YdbS with pleckstrin-like domain